MIIEIRREWHPWTNVGGDIRIGDVRRGRWVRFAVYYGQPPGSRMGIWRTRCDTLRGWNWRYGGMHRCVSVLVHWRWEP